jgi:hypothetical protein
MREETDADTQRPHCVSSDYFSSDFKVHDFLPAVNTSYCWQYVWYLSKVLLPIYIIRNIVAYDTRKLIKICRPTDHPVLSGGVKSRNSDGGRGEDFPWYSTTVEDHTYSVIYIALDNLFPL